jgi:hypothetical protein
MQRILLRVASVVLWLSVSGCAGIADWAAGSITEGIPKLRERLPRTAKIHLADPVNARGYALHERSRRQIWEAFRKAFDSIGVAHSSTANGCSHAIYVAVDGWAYGDSGFFGGGGRDEVSMSVMLQRLDTERILSRASLHAYNLDLLAERYVKSIFEDEK